MMHGLMALADIGRINPGSHGFDTLSVPGQQQAGTIRAERFRAVGMSYTGFQDRDEFLKAFFRC
jgi:hypothetical protein